MPVLDTWDQWTLTRLSDHNTWTASRLIKRDFLSVSVNPGFGADNPFDVFHYTLEGSAMKVPDGWTVSGQSDFMTPPDAYLTDNTWEDSAHILARTNPSRPAVLLPVYWLELKDIPDMLRQAGRFLLNARNWRQYVRRDHRARDLATANLAFQFGWMPLLADMYKLATFQDACEKRRKFIEKSYKKGGYRMRIGLDDGYLQVSPRRILVSPVSWLTFLPTLSQECTVKRWATVRWLPQDPSGKIPTKDEDLRPYLNGLHPSHILANAWEALPWSWLIDYFTNIGDMIVAGNHHLATPVGGSQMRMCTTRASHDSVVDDWFTQFRLLPGTITVVRKSRVPISLAGGPTASVPNLGTGQMSILASLAYLKR